MCCRPNGEYSLLTISSTFSSSIVRGCSLLPLVSPLADCGRVCGGLVCQVDDSTYDFLRHNRLVDENDKQDHIQVLGPGPHFRGAQSRPGVVVRSGFGWCRLQTSTGRYRHLRSLAWSRA